MSLYAKGGLKTKDKEVGSITSNVGTSKPRPYRPSINADKYFAKGIKKSADDSNKSSIDGLVVVCLNISLLH